MSRRDLRPLPSRERAANGQRDFFDAIDKFFKCIVIESLERIRQRFVGTRMNCYAFCTKFFAIESNLYNIRNITSSSIA